MNVSSSSNCFITVWAKHVQGQCLQSTSIMPSIAKRTFMHRLQARSIECRCYRRFPCRARPPLDHNDSVQLQLMSLARWSIRRATARGNDRSPLDAGFEEESFLRMGHSLQIVPNPIGPVGRRAPAPHHNIPADVASSASRALPLNPQIATFGRSGASEELTLPTALVAFRLRAPRPQWKHSFHLPQAPRSATMAQKGGNREYSRTLQ
jgi:hypothetical protein